MFKRNCAVKFVDNFGIEHAAKVEAESLFEAAIRRLFRLQRANAAVGAKAKRTNNHDWSE